LIGKRYRGGSSVLRIEVLATSLKQELPMTNATPISPLRQRMIEDMSIRRSSQVTLSRLLASLPTAGVLDIRIIYSDVGRGLLLRDY
jgi:hypothetical protein